MKIYPETTGEILLRNSDHALAIQRAGKFFIYDEHYDLSPLAVLCFLCKLFEAALKLLKMLCSCYLHTFTFFTRENITVAMAT